MYTLCNKSGITAVDIASIHVRDIVFPFIKNIHDGEKTLFSQHMKDAVFIIPKPSLLQEAVAILDDLNITAQNRDTQGDIYEYLLSELKTAGKNGQFRTPRHIIGMIVELVDPDIGDRICDPACGTASFLMNMVLHGIATPNIEMTDTLSRGFTEENKYTVVLANPPFKGSIDKSDINDHLTVGTGMTFRFQSTKRSSMKKSSTKNLML